MTISVAGEVPDEVIPDGTGFFTKTYVLDDLVAAGVLANADNAAELEVEVIGTLPGAGVNGTDAVASETRKVKVLPN